MSNDLSPPQPGINKPGDPARPVADENQAAVNLIRQKLQHIYQDEPNVSQELQEVAVEKQPLSKHQTYMQQLQASGKSLAEIQTAWHNYYVSLPDNEKRAVWQEFYDSISRTTYYQHAPQTAIPTSPALNAPAKPVVVNHAALGVDQFEDFRNVYSIKQQLLQKVSNRQRITAKQHFKSLLFGVGMGVVAIIILLFSFFNQIIITPLIQPSRTIGNEPLIITASTVSASSVPEVIIPKINVEIPTDYSQTSTNEAVIESALNNGVVHYPNTVFPGQVGNAAFFGHSSNNIFNPGKYKFAFVLLHTLTDGDTFYLTYNGKVYGYQVIDHKIVPPNDVAVLNDTEGHTATATLITCDPPGTSINRLVVTGIQVSPDPSANANPPRSAAPVAQPATLPDNGPSLWKRLWSAL